MTRAKARLESQPGWSWIPALVVVFLLFAPQLAVLGVERNRYFLFWSRLDTLAACAAIGVLGLLAIGAGHLVNRSGSVYLRGVRDQVLAACFGLGVVVNLLPLMHIPAVLDFLREHRSLSTWVLRLALLAALVAWGWLSVSRPALLPRLVRSACLILSPLIPIVLVPAFAWSGWYVPPDPIPPSAMQKDGTPVYLFVFDEWSFTRSTEGDDFLADQPHLRDLRARSFFFRHARSASRTTYISLPEILFQSSEFPSLPRVYLSRSDFPARVPPGAPDDSITAAVPAGRQPPSLFTEARSAGYATYMLGYYLPYRRILGDDVDVVRAFSDYPRGDSFAGQMMRIAFQNPHYYRLPVLSHLWKMAYAPFFSRHWVHLNTRMMEDFDAVVDASPRRSFVFLHYPSPHAPFVLDAGGRYRGPFPIISNVTEDVDNDIMHGTPDDYHASLRHLDTVVGHIVDRLRAAGRFDDALIIMTSDHSWRNDPDIVDSTDPELVRHVPLLIKVPGQTSAHTVDTYLNEKSLGPIIDLALRGILDEASAAKSIAALADAAPARPAPAERHAAAGGHGSVRAGGAPGDRRGTAAGAPATD